MIGQVEESIIDATFAQTADFIICLGRFKTLKGNTIEHIHVRLLIIC